MSTCSLLREALFAHESGDGHWYGACDAVLAATFQLEQDPETCVGDALRSLAEKAQLLSDEPEGKAGALARCLHAAGAAALLGLVAVEDLGSRMKKGAQPVKKVVVEGDDDDLANAAGGAGEDAERDARLLRLVEEKIVGTKADGFVAALAPVAAKVASRAPRSARRRARRAPPERGALPRQGFLCLSRCVRGVSPVAHHDAGARARRPSEAERRGRVR